MPSTVSPMVGPVLEFTVGRSAGPSLISLVVSVDVKHHVYRSAAHSTVRAALRPRRKVRVTLKERGEIAGRASDPVQVERVVVTDLDGYVVVYIFTVPASGAEASRFIRRHFKRLRLTRP